MEKSSQYFVDPQNIESYSFRTEDFLGALYPELLHPEAKRARVEF